MKKADTTKFSNGNRDTTKFLMTKLNITKFSNEKADTTNFVMQLA